MKFEYAQSLIQEIESMLAGAKVEDRGNSIAVISRGQILAITEKTEDVVDDIDRLQAFLAHMISTGGKILTAPSYYSKDQ